MIHNVKVIAGAAASTASAAASGTGAVLNFAGSKMMANMTPEDYRELEAETQRAIHAQQTSAVVAQMHDRAYQVQQENKRLALEAANKQKTEAAIALAQQQELDFEGAGSSASSSQPHLIGAGRRGNLQRSLELRIHQTPPTRKKTPAQHVRNEDAVEGFGRRLARGLSSLF